MFVDMLEYLMGAALSPTEFLDSLKINLEREGEFQICLCLMIPLIYDQLDLPVPLLVQMAGVLSFVGSICLRRVLSRRTAANDCASRTEDRCAFDFSRCYPVCSIIDKCYGGKEHRRVSVCYIFSSLYIPNISINYCLRAISTRAVYKGKSERCTRSK